MVEENRRGAYFAPPPGKIGLKLDLLNEQAVREKHVLGHTCHGPDN